jgi:hypothetical protein
VAVRQILLLILVVIQMIPFSACSNKLENQIITPNQENTNILTNTDHLVLQGNSNGNILNKGLAAISNGWVYFRDIDAQLSKMKINGSDKITLNSDFPGYINVSGEWIYYCNFNDNWNVYKAKTDGSERSKILDEKTSNLLVYDNCLYYLENISLFVTDLCKVSVNGKGKKVLAKNVVDFNIANGFIYYLDESTKSFYKMEIGNFERILISKDDILRFIVQNDFVFFLSVEDNEKLALYRMNIDGSEKYKIADTDTPLFNTDDIWVYFIKDKKLIKVMHDGKNMSEVIKDINPLSIIVLDDWIYYSIDPSEGLLYKVKTDGSITNDVNNGQWVNKFPLNVTASSYLVEGATKYIPNNLIDNDESTAWVEGSKGDGIGEWISFENMRVVNGKKVGMTECVKGMYIFNGYGKTEEFYYSNNRVKEVRIEFSNGKSISAELEDGLMYPQQIDFGDYLETESIKVTILSVYKGKKYADTCISEVFFYSIDWDGGCEGGI